MQSNNSDLDMRLEDFAPEALGPDQISICGLTPGQIHKATRNLFNQHQDMLNSSFDKLGAEDYIIEAFRRHALLLERGKDWLLEPLRLLQPKTYSLLTSGDCELWSGFQVRNIEFPVEEKHYFPCSYLFFKDRAYFLNPYGRGMNPSESRESPLLQAMPDILFHAWLSRIGEWQFIRQVPHVSLPHAGPLWHPPLWNTIKGKLQDYSEVDKKAHLASLERYFGKEDWTGKGGGHNLVCFLDTQVPGTFTKKGPFNLRAGDQFYIHFGRRDKTVYHFRNGDFSQIRLIAHEDVGHAFDGYFSHLFSRKSGEYDFMLYSKILEKL